MVEAPTLSLVRVGGTIRATSYGVPGPLTVDSGGRFLRDATGAPWLMVADSPQGMLVNCSTSEMATYFAARAAQGFNCAQVHVLASTTFGSSGNFHTYDSIAPFTAYLGGATTSSYNLDAPSSDYFARLDSLLTIAEGYGVTVMLTAAEYIDGEAIYKDNGTTGCYDWGAYLGARYSTRPNVLWNVGNDFQDWETDTGAMDALTNVVDGIKSQDTNHLHTAWLNYKVSASRDSTDFASRSDIDFGYTYCVAYDLMKIERALSPAKPVFLAETGYQNENLYYTNSALQIRKQNYWTMLAGGCGVTVMNDHWELDAGWDTSLQDTCFLDAQRLKGLFTAYQWQNLVPDTTHVYLAEADVGTEATGEVYPPDNNFAACAYIAGSLCIVYTPSWSGRNFTVDMSQFSGSVRCRWYDPTNGTYSDDPASPHANSGTHDFSRAANNAAGDSDWLLVLDLA